MAVTHLKGRNKLIEHFKKFDTDKKKLLPLSFSHLNEFAFNRERWALRRIFGYEFPTSASAERGTAVETALNMIMTGSDYEVAKAKMISDFEVKVSTINDPKTDEEREYLEPLLKIGVDSFHKHALNWNLLNYQKKVELTIKDIPFVGYTDFHFEDKNTKEDFYIDLKTSKRKPFGISTSHAMQQSIYQRATNANQKLWYLITRKSGSDFYQLQLDDYQAPMKMCEHIVSVMGNYLSKVDSLDDVKNSLIPNPDDWFWKDEHVLKARKEVWGY